MQHEIPELDNAGLRRFGLTTGGIVAVLFGLFFPWLLDREWPVWPWVIAAPLWLLALAYPAWLRPIYYGWMRFGLLLSKITTPIVLGTVFFLVISPISLVWRVRAKDPMHRTFEPDVDSYRVPTQKHETDRLEKPY